MCEGPNDRSSHVVQIILEVLHRVHEALGCLDFVIATQIGELATIFDTHQFIKIRLCLDRPLSIHGHARILQQLVP